MADEKLIIISACLAGYRCRYDGGHKERPRFMEKVKRGEAVPLCPEQLGGLPTPRSKARITSGDGFDVLSGAARVVDEEGRDVTEQFLRGAGEVLKLARNMDAVKAVLCEGSPSCGVNYISSGGGKIEGMGVSAALLRSEGVVVEAASRESRSP
jgi:uncharacterized protein YbbK (DUF523 family)